MRMGFLKIKKILNRFLQMSYEMYREFARDTYRCQLKGTL